MAEKHRTVLNSSWLVVAMWMLVLPGSSRAQSPEGSGPEPKIGISVTSTDKGVLYRGWPLVMSLSLTHPEAQLAKLKGGAAPAPILLAASSGKWSRFVKLVITDANEDIQRWRIQLLTVAGSSLQLNADDSGRLDLVMPGTETLNLPPGRYTVQAWLDSRTNSTAQSWKGVKTSRVELKVQPPPFILSDPLRCEKGFVFSEYYKALGDLTQAADALSSALFSAPGELLCIIARGEIVARQGDIKGAIDLYRLAMEKKALLPGDPDDSGSELPLLPRCMEFVRMLPANERPPPGIACAYDRVLLQESEPNDTAASANERMRPSTMVQGAVSSSGDADWFTFATLSSGSVNVKLLIPGTEDLSWFLYESSDLENAVAGGSTRGNPGLGHYDVPAPGLYFVKVVGNSGATSRYTLEASGLPIRP